MNPRLLKILIYISGVIALFVFLSVRIQPEKTMNLLLKVKTYPQYEDSTRYSELYYINLIKDFREELPHAIRKYRNSPSHPTLNEADIIVYGDSHFDHSRQLTIPELLSIKTNKKVFYHRIDAPFWGNVMSFLEISNYKSSKEGFLIYGSAERYIFERFQNSYEVRAMNSDKSLLRSFVEDFLFPANGEFLYSTLLKRSYLTHDVSVEIATMKFRTLGYINAQTPEYYIDKKNGSWLFFDESIDHFGKEYSQEEINRVSLNIKNMADVLKENYNLDFIFVPVPEKYSVYYALLDKNENYDFLPGLYKELDKLNVPYIDLYSDFKSSEKIVYHRTDTHWNENGVKIALEKLLREIHEINNNLY